MIKRNSFFQFSLAIVLLTVVTNASALSTCIWHECDNCYFKKQDMDTMQAECILTVTNKANKNQVFEKKIVIKGFGKKEFSGHYLTHVDKYKQAESHLSCEITSVNGHRHWNYSGDIERSGKAHRTFVIKNSKRLNDDKPLSGKYEVKASRDRSCPQQVL